MYTLRIVGNSKQVVYLVGVCNVGSIAVPTLDP